MHKQKPGIVSRLTRLVGPGIGSRLELHNLKGPLLLKREAGPAAPYQLYGRALAPSNYVRIMPRPARRATIKL